MTARLAFRAMMVTLAVLLLGCPADRPLRDFGSPGSFRLIDQGGQAFGSAELAGKVYAVSFFFSSCATICPRLMAVLEVVQERARSEAPGLHIISITVDPETDTPERLHGYGTELGIDFATWTLLTGAHADVEKVVVKGFMTYMGKRETDEGGLMDIGHGSHFLLVDQAGRLRGIHEHSDGGVDALLRDAARLLKGGT